MSKQIDFSDESLKTLSAEDSKYVLERPWLIQEARVFGFVVDEDSRMIYRPASAVLGGEDGNPLVTGSEVAKVADAVGEPAEEAPEDRESGSEVEDEVPPYEEWIKPDLIRELDARGVAHKKGDVKDELVDLLRLDDEGQSSSTTSEE